jgi:hypothetical protein
MFEGGETNSAGTISVISNRLCRYTSAVMPKDLYLNPTGVQGFPLLVFNPAHTRGLNILNINSFKWFNEAYVASISFWVIRRIIIENFMDLSDLLS